MNNAFKATLALAFLTTGSATTATPFTLNTGAVWDAENYKFTQLPDGALETRYTISGLYSTATVHPANLYPLIAGPWVGNVDPDGGQWIGTGEAVGATFYSIAFSMAAPLSLEVAWASDNASQLSLNGIPIATTDGWPSIDTRDYTRWETTTLDLVAGLNTVSFEVRNLGGPAGLIVHSSAFPTGPVGGPVQVSDGGSTLFALGAAVAGLFGVRCLVRRT